MRAAAVEHGKTVDARQCVMRAGAAVEHLPEARRIARILAYQQRRELLIHYHRQPGIVGGAGDGGLALAPDGEAGIGVDAHDGGIEGVERAVVAGVPALGRDRHMHPEAADCGDLH